MGAGLRDSIMDSTGNPIYSTRYAGEKMEMLKQMASEVMKSPVIEFYEELLGKASSESKLTLFHGIEILKKMLEITHNDPENLNPDQIASELDALISSEPIHGDSTEDQGMQLIPRAKRHADGLD